MRALLAALLITWPVATYAQDNLTLARELIDLKGGYVEKKRLLEDARLQAYVPILLKAVGKGQDWKPSHANWKSVESRIASDWMQLNAEYLRSLGRDPAYDWFDNALTRDYAQAFTGSELRQLAGFYRSTAGRTLLDLERKLLGFYPASMVRAFALSMVSTETLSGRESELFNSPLSRIRRDFVRLFETEAIIREESFRAGGTYAEASYPTVQQASLQTGSMPCGSCCHPHNARPSKTFSLPRRAARSVFFSPAPRRSLCPPRKTRSWQWKKKRRFTRSLGN